MDIDYGKIRFPAPLSVTELNSFVKDLLDNAPPLTDLYVKGEISNFKAHSAGHYYFSLKDEASALKCVMFRSDVTKIPFVPENGMKVIAHGRVGAFVRDGAYQLYVNDLQPDGVGAMYVALEQLKNRLSAEGLFDPSKKKPIPKIPARVGVVTSPTGAAVRDIINVCGRRFPFAEITVYPALVQGDGAPQSISKGIEYFNKNNLADVLIVGRGGGSVEDLWAFNTEIVARAVAASRIPVISAVGHETDFTVCDLVSDLRAPTPSAAAEIAVPDTAELKHKFNNIVTKESAVLLRRISTFREILSAVSHSRSLVSPKATVDDRRMTVLSLSDKLEGLISDTLCRKKTALSENTAALNAMNPLAVLSRGYSAVFTSDGEVINKAEAVNVGDKVILRLSDGSVTAEALEINID